jgi:hypothetical protein
MDEWVALFASRDEIAFEYARLLRHNGTEWKTWPTLNLAIIDRWSQSGLEYIKRKAWKLAQEYMG